MDAAEVEMDPAKREAMLRQLLAMNAENASTIFLVELVDVFGLHKRVQGFEYPLPLGLHGTFVTN